MIATLVFQLSQIESGGGGALDASLYRLPPQSIGAIVLVLIPLSFFISAIMMTVSLLARSFKEAQNYVTPFFLAITFPAGIVAIPGIDLSDSARLIPIANASLLFRDLMTGTVAIDTIFIVFIATSIYALLALLLAAWMFQREEVILSEEKGIPLTLRRASFEPLEMPTPGLSLGLFGMVMLLLFYAGSYVQARDIASGLVITQYLLIAAPVIFVLWFARINLKSALQLTRPPWISLLGVAIMMPAWAVLAAQVGIWQEKIMPAPESYLTEMQRIFEELGEAQSVPMLLFILALSPGICEELAFRGAILSGLRDKLPSWASVLVVGLLFGLFHLSIYRFFPQALSGFLLTYLALRTRSIFPAILAHLSLNGILTQIERIPEPIMETITAPNFEQDGFNVGAVAAAAIVLTAGIGVVEWEARRHARRIP
jgi:sodium transport system permease protein